MYVSGKCHGGCAPDTQGIERNTRQLHCDILLCRHNTARSCLRQDQPIAQHLRNNYLLRDFSGIGRVAVNLKQITDFENLRPVLSGGCGAAQDRICCCIKIDIGHNWR